VQSFEAGLERQLAPEVCDLQNVRYLHWPKHSKQRFALHGHIARVGKSTQQPGKMSAMIVVSRIGLLDQNPVWSSMPDACPGLIRPAKAKAEIGRSGRDNIVERPFEQQFSCKPVVVVAESFDPMLARELGLGSPGFRNTQIVETQVRRDMWLVVAWIQGFRFRRVRPFSKPLAPPGVVFRDLMELRKVKRDQPRICFHDTIP